jgi:hypothetical protein
MGLMIVFWFFVPFVLSFFFIENLHEPDFIIHPVAPNEAADLARGDGPDACVWCVCVCVSG